MDFLSRMTEFIKKFSGVTFHYILVPGAAVAAVAATTADTATVVAADTATDVTINNAVDGNIPVGVDCIKIGFEYKLIKTYSDGDFINNDKFTIAAPTAASAADSAAATVPGTLWFIFKTHENNKVSDFFSNSTVMGNLEKYFGTPPTTTAATEKATEPAAAAAAAKTPAATENVAKATEEDKPATENVAKATEEDKGGSSHSTRRRRLSSSNKPQPSKNKTLKNH